MTSTRAARTAESAAQSRPVLLLGRIGIAAHAVVYLLIAYLALRIAFSGSKGKTTDKNGALQTVAEQPFGKFALWVIAIGLLAFVIWQFAEAAFGYRYVRDKKKRALKRVASAGEGIVFGAIGVTAAKIALGGSAQTAQNKTFTAKVLALPAGQVLVAVVGIAVMAIAAFIVYRGVTKRFTEDLNLGGASAPERKAAIRLGQSGYAALGVAYMLVGGLIVIAAVNYDPQKATGLDAALKTLAGQPYGKVMLTIVAAGLVAYGLYGFLDAKYRKA